MGQRLGARGCSLFAVRLQNCLWGISAKAVYRDARQNRFGRAGACSSRGGLLYALGSRSWQLDYRAGLDPRDRHLCSANRMSCNRFNIVFGALGRAYSARERGAVVVGISSAAGSFGQFALLPPRHSSSSRLRLVFRADRVVAAVARDDAASFGVAAQGGYHGTLDAGAGRIAEGAPPPRFPPQGPSGCSAWGYLRLRPSVRFHRHALPGVPHGPGTPVRDGTISLSAYRACSIFFGSYPSRGQLGGRFLEETYLLSGVYAPRAGSRSHSELVSLTPMSAYLFAATMGFSLARPPCAH